MLIYMSIKSYYQMHRYSGNSIFAVFNIDQCQPILDVMTYLLVLWEPHPLIIINLKRSEWLPDNNVVVTEETLVFIKEIKSLFVRIVHSFHRSVRTKIIRTGLCLHQVLIYNCLHSTISGYKGWYYINLPIKDFLEVALPKERCCEAAPYLEKLWTV